MVNVYVNLMLCLVACSLVVVCRLSLTLVFTSRYHLSNYNFDSKDLILKRDTSLPASLLRLRAEYELTGMRQSVEAIVLVHEHNLPHVLLMQVAPTLFILPGGEVGIDEKDTDALKRHLNQVQA